MGDLKTFLIATFNANGIRARMPIILKWLEKNPVDCLCIQETKVQDQDFPEAPFTEAGFNVIFRGQKAYNGVAVVSPHEIESAAFGFSDDYPEEDDETRLARCTIKGMHIVNTYVPQGRAIDHPNYQKKLAWFSRLRRLFEENYSKDDPLLWCGDMNVAPEPIDVYHPEKKEDHVCYHIDARRAFKKVVEWGFVDLFRKFHPDEPKQYTFYDYRLPKAIERGLGWRIDHILATRPMAERAADCWIDLEPRLWKKPSDHTFLVASFRE